MRAPATIPIVKLTGNDGNVLGIMGRIKRVLRAGGADQEYINKYLQESMSGEADHLLSTAMKYVDVR